MNVTLASLPLDTNTLIVLVMVIISGISTWLEKKRKAAEAENAQKENRPPQPSPQEDAPEQPDMEEVLRRLLGGGPPLPKRTPPAMPPPVDRSGADPRRLDPQPLVISREDQEESGWREAVEAPYETTHARVERAADPPPQLTPTPAPSPILRIEKGSEQTVWHPQKPIGPPRRSSMIVNTHRRRRSPEGDRVIAQLRNSRAVRSAFVASLVFGPPKSLENSQP